MKEKEKYTLELSLEEYEFINAIRNTIDENSLFTISDLVLRYAEKEVKLLNDNSPVKDKMLDLIDTFNTFEYKFKNCLKD